MTAAALGAVALGAKLTKNLQGSSHPATQKGGNIKAVRDAISKVDREELRFDKAMHNLGCTAGWVATGASLSLVAAFAAVALPVVAPVAVPVAAGLGAVALGSKLTRHFMTSGSRAYFIFPWGYKDLSGWTKRLDFSKK